MAGERNLDWYENELEKEDLPEDVREKYEAIADRLASAYVKTKEKLKNRVDEEQVRLADLKARLLAGDLTVVDVYGIPEFGKDYEVLPEGENYIVHSKVCNEHQESRHSFTNLKEATSKYRQLIYYRLYDKYVRTGEVDNIEQIE